MDEVLLESRRADRGLFSLSTRCPRTETHSKCKDIQKEHFAAHGEQVREPAEEEPEEPELRDEVKEEPMDDVPSPPRSGSPSPLKCALKRRKVEMETEEAEGFRDYQDFGDDEVKSEPRDPIAISSAEEATGGATGSGIRRPRDGDDGERPAAKAKAQPKTGIKREPTEDGDNAHKYRQLETV